MYPVVIDLQCLDAGCFTFPDFQFFEELVGVLAQGTQLIQFGVIPFGDEATVAGEDGWVFTDGLCLSQCLGLPFFLPQRLPNL